RSGSTAICEFLSLRKPMLLVPLTLSASRGDQLLNAQSFADRGFSKVLFEEELTPDSLIHALDELEKERERYVSRMKEYSQDDSVERIVNILRSLIKTEFP